VELAEKQLQRLPTGGRTPLAHALLLTSETIQRLRRHEPEQAMLIIALSDGKANVPLPDSPQGVDAWAQTEQVATQLSALKISTLFLDTEASLIRVGRGQDLAECLKASYLRLDDMSADGLVHTIRQAVG
jgi:magnesium chelatase subunit D